MESNVEYLQSIINERRSEYLYSLDIRDLQYLAQEYDIENSDVLVEHIIEDGRDLKEYGDNYWVRIEIKKKQQTKSKELSK